MKKHGLLLLILALLCLSVFSAAAYADDSLYPLAFTERQTTYNGRTTTQIMEKPYETWFFLNDGKSVYVTTGERYSYTRSAEAGKTVIGLDGGRFDNHQIVVETDSASAVATFGNVTDTYLFRVMRSEALFRAVIDSAIQDGSMLEYTWHAEGGNGGILYRYHIYDSGKNLVESGTTIESSFRFMPVMDDTYTLFLTAVDDDSDVSEYATAETAFKDDPDFVIVDGKVTAYTGTGTVANVPDTVAGTKVTGIGQRVFSNASALEKIYLPKDISEIETNAFSGSRAKILCQIKDEEEGKPTAAALELSKKRLNFYDRSTDDGCAFELLYMEIDGEKNTLVLTSYKGSEKNVVIPPDVKYIYNNAFKEKEMVESVTIHDGVTGIGQNAFKDCSRLASVGLNQAAALRRISDSAFEGCGSIKTLELPQNLLSIGERAFANCEAMQKLDLRSDFISDIGAGAFYNCPADIYCGNLDSLTAKTISALPHPFFYEQGDLTLELRNVEGELVLDNCTGTGKTLNIECDSLKVISANAFQDNKSLETVSIPASVTRIEDSAFRGCSRLVTFSIPEGSKLQEIGDYAFNGCSRLNDIILPDNQLKIGMHAFSECTSMDEITLPDNVLAIGANAFYNGPKKVYCSSYTVPPAFLVSALPQTFWYKEGTNPEMELRWENDNSDLVLYSFHGDPDVEVPDYVTEIRADAFENEDMRDTLKSVKIPASVTVLPTGLFDGYDKLEEIELVGNKSVENGAIRNCAALERVIGLTDLTVIDTNFDNCPQLMLAMPYDDLRLATQLDYAKKAVLTATLPADAVILYTNGKVAQLNKADGVVTAYSAGSTRIYMYAGGKVGSCDVTVYADLPGLVLPKNLTQLEEEAFMGNPSCRYALLPDGLTAIGNRAFADNERLLLINIPDTVTSFGGPDIIPETAVAVFHDTNTAAQEYCNTYGINWQYMP